MKRLGDVSLPLEDDGEQVLRERSFDRLLKPWWHAQNLADKPEDAGQIDVCGRHFPALQHVPRFEDRAHAGIG